ncbi:putative Pentatricopeptide repeat-containing protein [Abeliophyllum distichum]|uniref:Pentatricopeptide repeat-containing protein n=1 Tax=Abeliophyllum distichum TaxID=126358 RepID=A0ABD1TGR4_9LAMI
METKIVIMEENESGDFWKTVVLEEDADQLEDGMQVVESQPLTGSQPLIASQDNPFQGLKPADVGVDTSCYQDGATGISEDHAVNDEDENRDDDVGQNFAEKKVLKKVIKQYSMNHFRKMKFAKDDKLIQADVLKSCAAISGVNLGKALHGQVIKHGHNSCQFVLKALLNMYAKCKALEDCQKLFGEINSRDIVTWNIVLSGFAGTLKDDNKVMQFFRMLHFASDPKPTSVTLAIVFPVYTRSSFLSAGKSIHSYAIKSGMESLTLVGNALVSMYAKCGLVLDASAVFHGIADKDVVSWNAIIAGFAENKLVNDAFQIFQWMIKGQVVPNYATVANILSICAGLGEIVGYRSGKEIHCYVLRRAELGGEVTIFNALLSFYLRLGQIREAESLFRRMKFRDLVSWNSIIAGYASNGESLKALEMFCEFVVVEKIEPDSVTLLSILPACALLSNLHVGKQIHGFAIRRRGLFEDTSIGNALISFYAKSGCTEAAFFDIFTYSSKRCNIMEHPAGCITRKET